MAPQIDVGLGRDRGARIGRRLNDFIVATREVFRCFDRMVGSLIGFCRSDASPIGITVAWSSCFGSCHFRLEACITSADFALPEKAGCKPRPIPVGLDTIPVCP